MSWQHPLRLDRDTSDMDREEIATYAEALKRLNDTLAESLEVVEQTTADGFWDWYIPDDFEYMSPRFWRIFGYEPEEKRHHPSEWQALIHPDDLPPTLARFEEHVRTRGAVPFDQHVRYRHKLGYWVTVRCCGRVIEWGPDGEPIRMVGTHTDLTQLLEERTRAEVLASSANVGLWDWLDLEREELYWSPQLYELLGFEVGELVASIDTLVEQAHADDRDALRSAIERLRAGEEALELELRMHRKGGDYRWFLALAKVAEDRDGMPARIVGSLLDIQGRRQAEAELQELHVRHQLSLEASNIGVWDWDVVEDVLVWDEQMYRLYGMRAEDFGSAYEVWLQGVHPDDKERGDAEVRASLEDPAIPFDTQFRVVHPTGEARTIRAIATVLRDPHGTPLRMVGVNWDITEMERTKEDLRRANDDLTQFAYRASHDLKAPLTTIQGLADVIQEDLTAGRYDEVASNVARVSERAERLVELVDDVLSLTRADQAETENSVVSMSAELARVLAQVADAFPDAPVRAHHEVEGMFDAPLPIVRLRQIVANLVSNSIKYHDPQEAEPYVVVRAVDQCSALQLEVEDNGRGIPVHRQGEAFQMFQRFHSGVTGGSGLGLAIVERHVERLHGTIDLESSHRGTTIRITIPYR